jgi:Domain of unknown function (DUF5615)
VLAFATRSGRALLTLNRWQFVALHARAPRHAGIFVCTLDLDVERLASAIHAAVESAGSVEGTLLRINRPS